MATPNILNAGIPQSVPFLAPDGSVSQAWLYYFISLGVRTSMPSPSGTGQGGAGISVAGLMGEIAGLSVEVALSDIPDQTVTLINVTAGISSGFLLSEASADAAVRPVLNPILAAMLVEP